MVNWRHRVEEVVAAAYDEPSPDMLRRSELKRIMVQQFIDESATITEHMYETLYGYIITDPLWDVEEEEEDGVFSNLPGLGELKPDGNI